MLNIPWYLARRTVYLEARPSALPLGPLTRVE